MNILFSIISILLALSSGNSDLTIQVNGIEKIKGKIQVGIYNDENKFPKIGGEYRVVYFTVVSKEMKCTIKDLPDGDYAIALYQDVNADGACNLNFFGIPTEPYGFSNNIKPVLSAPSFSRARISVFNDLNISITLLD